MQLAAALSMHNTHASAGGCISLKCTQKLQKPDAARGLLLQQKKPVPLHYAEVISLKSGFEKDFI